MVLEVVREDIDIVPEEGPVVATVSLPAQQRDEVVVLPQGGSMIGAVHAAVLHTAFPPLEVVLLRDVYSIIIAAVERTVAVPASTAADTTAVHAASAHGRQKQVVEVEEVYAAFEASVAVAHAASAALPSP